jgi:hypothetical protein
VGAPSELESQDGSDGVAERAEEQDRPEGRARLRQVGPDEVRRVGSEPHADDEPDRQSDESRDLKHGSASVAAVGRQRQQQQEGHVEDGHGPISSHATAAPQPSTRVIAP